MVSFQETAVIDVEMVQGPSPGRRRLRFSFQSTMSKTEAGGPARSRGSPRRSLLPEAWHDFSLRLVNGMLTWALTCLIVILVEVVVSFSEAHVRVRWIVQSLCVLFLILLLVHTLLP